jgi:hypothetical protein
MSRPLRYLLLLLMSAGLSLSDGVARAGDAETATFNPFANRGIAEVSSRVTATEEVTLTNFVMNMARGGFVRDAREAQIQGLKDAIFGKVAEGMAYAEAIQTTHPSRASKVGSAAASRVGIAGEIVNALFALAGGLTAATSMYQTGNIEAAKNAAYQTVAEVFATAGTALAVTATVAAIGAGLAVGATAGTAVAIGVVSVGVAGVVTSIISEGAGNTAVAAMDTALYGTNNAIDLSLYGTN